MKCWSGWQLWWLQPGNDRAGPGLALRRVTLTVTHHTTRPDDLTGGSLASAAVPTGQGLGATVSRCGTNDAAFLFH